MLRHKGWRAAKVDLPALPASRTPPSSPPRKSKSSKKTLRTAIRHRNRSRHHQLRARLRGDPRRRRPVRARERAAAGRPATRESGRSARRRPAALVPLPARRRPIFRPARIALPWDEERDYVVGRLAQKRGVENAGRLVSSAKIWLSHSGVDRTVATAALPRAGRRRARSRPWKPAAATWSICAQAWDAKMPDAPFTEQQVLVTVPGIVRRRGARADPGSRASRPAIRTSRCSKSRRPPSTPGSSGIRTGASASSVGDLILVVDIGGGTTDFTLIAVTEQRRRTGARTAWPSASTSCWAATTSISRWPAWSRSGWPRRARASTAASTSALGTTAASPRRSCSSPESKAKEQPVTILGKGTGLVGGTIKATLLRADIEQVLGEGFLPDGRQHRDARAASAASGLQELGLPYAADAADHAAHGALPAAAGRHRRARRGAPRPERPGLPDARAVQRRRAASATWSASASSRR